MSSHQKEVTIPPTSAEEPTTCPTHLCNNTPLGIAWKNDIKAQDDHCDHLHAKAGGAHPIQSMKALADLAALVIAEQTNNPDSFIAITDFELHSILACSSFLTQTST